MDDTDSPEGMCTTYLGALVVRKLISDGYFVQNARLIRLNPNVIWKTRGNAGVCIETNAPKEYLFELACEYVERYAMFDCENTNPGVVVMERRPVPDFYYQALQRFCTVEEAEALLKAEGALYRGWKNRRGLIGATASVCAVLPDYTFEYLAYRRPENFGTPRQFEEPGFFASEKETAPHTWDTVDFVRQTVICIPHGKDPVLYGIRGDAPDSVTKAVSFLKTESPDFHQIWQTNQGTDAHILDEPLFDGGSFTFTGTVESNPVSQRGGHVCVTVSGVQCFAFEPTKYFRNYVRALVPGDEIRVYGSFTGGVLHMEKFHVERLADVERRVSPRCPLCGGRMTSAGTKKGWKCRECEGRIREAELVVRGLSEGAWYEVPPGSRRHLAKPVVRFSV
ncbi:MAG TPA: tRNA(Ile)(2)-agmatinylcytidine synthase [Methanocorpusculum sp.]|nr:tRNA(Ile)(2)-agmatinylcytidine synthase [Methanocorpusculum sp.]